MSAAAVYGAVEGPSGGADGAAAGTCELSDPEAGRHQPCPDPQQPNLRDRAKRAWEVTARKAKNLGDAVIGGPDDGPKEPEPPEWHANGTVLGLVIDIGSTFGYQMFLILTMFFGLEANKSRLLHCTVGPGELEFRDWPQAYLCEYTKSHLLVFPTLALTVVLVVMGRDLLQKRLYYGLLRNGGVVDFAQNKPFKDSLVLVLIVNYLHVAAQLALMYWVAYAREGDVLPEHVTPGLFRHEVDTIRSRVSGDNGHLHVLGFLWGAVMIPGTLVVAFVFLGYDIEKTLVPLSQYVHGLQESEDKQQVLGSLSVVRDACVKVVLEDLSGPVATASGSDLDTQYGAVVEAACQVSRETEDEHPSIGLQESLWPVTLLLRSNTPDADARTFRWLWLALASGAISLMVFALMTLGPELVKDVRRATIGGQRQVIAQAPTLVCGILLVCTVLKEFARTFRSHSPVKRKTASEGLDESPLSHSALSPPCPGASAGADDTECDKTK